MSVFYFLLMIKCTLNWKFEIDNFSIKYLHNFPNKFTIMNYDRNLILFRFSVNVQYFILGMYVYMHNKKIIKKLEMKNYCKYNMYCTYIFLVFIIFFVKNETLCLIFVSFVNTINSILLQNFIT